MKSLLLLFIPLLVLWGCSGKKTIPIAETSLLQKGKFETVWVNPRIVYSDSLCTLLSAQRLDSVFVRSSEHSLGDAMPTVTFEVTRPTCDVSASIVDARGTERAMLFAQTLAKAQYKLTLDAEQFQKLSLTGNEQLQVKLSLCGVTSRRSPVVAAPAQ